MIVTGIAVATMEFVFGIRDCILSSGTSTGNLAHAEDFACVYLICGHIQNLRIIEGHLCLLISICSFLIGCTRPPRTTRRYWTTGTDGKFECINKIWISQA